jgi:membrane protease YdiL (CAAX protease family)
VRFFAGLKLAAIGFIPWREWSATEKSYFVQILIIANVVFALVIKGPPAQALTPVQWVVVVMTSFFWGFYQELVYRGMLQTELTRRFGALAGVLVANIVFTFGPLHYYHFASSPPPIVMFAGIFAIGLFFGVLRHRSGNLWLPAVFHGIGTAWILGGV